MTVGALKTRLKQTWVGKVYAKLKIYKLTAKIRKLRRKLFKFATLKVIYPHVYRKYAKQPVDPNRVLFVEVRLPEISNSFQVLYRALEEDYDFQLDAQFLRNGFVDKWEYHRNCMELMKKLAAAKYVFMNEASNVVSCVKLRKETKIVQLWHGCGAFKKFGRSTADLIFGDSRSEMDKYPYYKNYSMVTVSSPEVIWAYSEAMGIPEDSGVIQAAGISRTDVFFQEEYIQQAFQRLYEQVPFARGKKVLLYAPTFRGRVAKAKTPDLLDVAQFAEALGDRYVLLFKHHPLVKKPPEVPEEYSSWFAMDVTKTMSIEDLICVSDICISDYSSLIYEYALFERPLLFLAHDLDEYFDWRGFYYNYDELTPGPVVKTNEEMIDYIVNIDTQFDKQKVIDFKQRFMSACDGHATERIMDMTFGDDLEKHKK